MAKNKSPVDKEANKKIRGINRIYNKFVSYAQDKKKAIGAVSGGSTRSFRHITAIEKRSETELKKIQAGAKLQIQKTKEGFEATAASARDDIKKSKDEVDRLKKDSKKAYNSFNTTYRAAMNGRSGIAVRQADIASRHDKIQQTHELINKLDKTVHTQASEINEAHKKSLQNNKEIADTRDRAQEVREEIENTYGITVDTTLAGSIIGRKRELEGLMGFWRKLMLAAFLAIVVIASILAFRNPAHSFLDLVQQKIAYLTPLAAVIIIAYREYKNERRYLEEYSFKATSAQILRGYTVLLGGDQYSDPGSKTKILKFLLDSMKGIFDRSSLDTKHTGSYHFAFGSKLARIEAKIKQEVLREVMTQGNTGSSTKVEVQQGAPPVTQNEITPD